MPTPHLVIFDCDGVLIDSESLACRADAACLREIGISVSADEIMERYVGLSAAAMIADLEQRYARTLPADIGERLQRHVAAAFAHELRAMAGIAAALGKLGCRFCVASSSTPERLRQSLALVDLLTSFHPNIFSASDVVRGKPAPDLFLHAAARMGVAPKECLVVEDSAAGVQAARAAGMAVLGFIGGSHCRPDHGERLLAAGAYGACAHMDQLVSRIG